MFIFILFFFLSFDLVKLMVGERVGVNDVIWGWILVCYKFVCVFRENISFCVLFVMVFDWLLCFLFLVCIRIGYI